MIKLNFHDINDRDFNQVLQKIDNTNGLDGKTVGYFNKFITVWKEQSKLASDGFMKLMEEHAEREPVLNEIDEPTYTNDGQPQTRIKTRQGASGIEPVVKDPETWQPLYKEFLNTSFEVNISKFHTKKLKNANLSPKEFRAIDKIAFTIEEA